MLHGRDAERATVCEAVAAARALRSGALVVSGEPGIGKTALLADARDQAADMHVLAARGIESESELPFAALHQLLRPALHLLDRLPPPQALAMASALGLGDRGGKDRFLISLATLTLLAELAEARPVLCLVDDAQWLDASSADALLFVARRIAAEGIVILFAARDGAENPFTAPDLPALKLGGLDAEASAKLLGESFANLPPSVRDALVEQSGGNPLGLIELPTALTDAQRDGAEPLPPTLPLTLDVERIFAERAQRLPEGTQRLLLLSAAETSGSLTAVLKAGATFGVDSDALQPAEAAGLLSIRDARIEIRHPLVRSAIYQASPYAERRAAHLALAQALDTEVTRDERAWHLAAGTPGPDEEVARELDAVADRAGLRSGHAAAATASQRAAALTADAEGRGRRLVAGAKSAWHAGQPERASTLVREATALVSDRRVRADLEHVRGVIQLRCGALVDAADILTAGAAAIAPVDVRKALEMLLEAREAAGWAGDTPRTIACDKRAGALPRSDDAGAQFLADLLVGVGSVYEGESAVGAPLVRDVVARSYEIDEPGWVAWAATGARALGDEAAEAALMRRALRLARASGAVDKLTYVLLNYSLMSLLGGRFGAAAEATEGVALARAAGLPNAESAHLAMLAWFAAVRGDERGCRAFAAEATQAASIGGAAFATSIGEWGVALFELSERLSDAAAVRLDRVSEGRPGEGHPFFAVMSAPDLVEACVLAGRRPRAREAAAAFRAFAAPGAPSWSLALDARCQALVADDDATATKAFEEALRLHAPGDRPFDRARTQLLYGEHLRRLRQRLDSREHFRAALDTFERLGATCWGERARVGLRASGETARKREPSTVAQLTPQELQIARFVAEGLSNKEVASQLFLSPRTIDAHLRNVFAKLGISSRTQLARAQLAGDDSAVAREVALAHA